MPEELRPRERLVEKGAQALSDRELLAVLLNTGIKGKNVNILASELLEKLELKKAVPTVEDLCGMTGLGKSKASAVAAMLEFGRRYWGVRGVRINNSADIYKLVQHYADRRQERFICLSMNGAHEVLASRIVTVGLVNKTIVHPREVFADVIHDRASAVCVAHNHPSGLTEPSGADDDITRDLQKAAGILGIRFLDHIIFTEESYYSYSKNGRLKFLKEKIKETGI